MGKLRQGAAAGLAAGGITAVGWERIAGLVSFKIRARANIYTCSWTHGLAAGSGGDTVPSREDCVSER